MPQTLSAKRALRKDRRRQAVNLLVRESLKKTLKLARKNLTAKNLSQASSALDQAAKKGVIHWKKASRLKSRLSKLLKERGVKEKPVTQKKKGLKGRVPKIRKKS